MKICDVCLKSDILCSGCTRKLEKGAITNTDIAMSRAAFRLGLNADFFRTIDHDGYVVVLADKKNSNMLIGRGGRNAKRLSVMLGRDLRVIEQTDDEKMLIEKLISAPVLGINKVYGNTEKYKVRMERRFKTRVSALAPLVSKVVGKEVTMVFE